MRSQISDIGVGRPKSVRKSSITVVITSAPTAPASKPRPTAFQPRGRLCWSGAETATERRQFYPNAVAVGRWLERVWIACPYCIAPWIASALVFASARAPRATRVIGGIFAITAGSDFLNCLYAKTKG